MPKRKEKALEAAKGDQLFEILSRLFALLVLTIALGGFVTLTVLSWPSIKTFGLSFMWTQTWDPVAGKFGALPLVVGTLVTSFLALLISTPFSLGTALFLAEYAPKSLKGIMGFTVELLAAIPSVIYGLWGIFFLVPLVRKMEIALSLPPYGVGAFTASLILAIMILPYATSVTEAVVSLVPEELKEGAYALGATRWEVTRYIIIPYARSGIFAGTILALGRALGETMAVTMVIGNRNEILNSIFAPTNTMASVIANEFTEATSRIYLASLVEIGLILFLITLVVNILARWITERLKVQRGGV
ncbi:MAG: phosphate ABC transporter permease subunit PstC [Aquificota bacterium]|nr:MAG: phosphate ABC transporter permease subunit PstC [Aquificota bacterium]